LRYCSVIAAAAVLVGPPEMAQISLRFGADDIDGTVIEEKIYHDAGATTPQGMRRADL
jgi:aminodeoxyfutalosine synthase